MSRRSERKEYEYWSEIYRPQDLFSRIWRSLEYHKKWIFPLDYAYYYIFGLFTCVFVNDLVDVVGRICTRRYHWSLEDQKGHR